MRISDWSSDVFSSDLQASLTTMSSCVWHPESAAVAASAIAMGLNTRSLCTASGQAHSTGTAILRQGQAPLYPLGNGCAWRRFGGARSRDRKSVVLGKRVSGGVDLGGRRTLKKK